MGEIELTRRGPRTTARTVPAVVAGCVLGILVSPVLAQGQAQVPAALENVGVTEHLDERLPMDLSFVDETGESVRLGQYFERERPVVLTLGYYRCRMLCRLVFQGVFDALEGFDWSAGDEYDIVTVSIDPLETHEIAAEKKEEFLGSYGRESAARGWHLLTGDEKSIRTLADAVGFHYRYVEQNGEYAHPAVMFIVTPDGRISRYLYGVNHDPQTVRLSLVEASKGAIGSTLDKVILYCFYYDPAAGSYVPAAVMIMRVAGGITLAVVGVWMTVYWRREARRKRKLA